MSLNDRLNRALDRQHLHPQVTFQPVMVEEVEEIDNKSYPTLADGIKAADTIDPDEFGIRIVVVEELQQTLLQLPMEETIINKYIVDDVQKLNKGGYEVHLVEKNQR